MPGLKLFEEVGITITREDIYELEGSNDKRLIKAIFEKAGKEPEPWHFEQLPERKREVLEFDQIKPFEGIPECLKELKKHFKLAMVSGSESQYSRKSCRINFFQAALTLLLPGATWNVENLIQILTSKRLRNLT